MTGLVVRILRDGQWQNLEVEELTDAELDAFCASKSPTEGWAWFRAMVRWVRDNVKEK